MAGRYNEEAKKKIPSATPSGRKVGGQVKCIYYLHAQQPQIIITLYLSYFFVNYRRQLF